MKQKLFSMLALLLMAATGAWAQETYKVTVKEGTEDATNWKAKVGNGPADTALSRTMPQPDTSSEELSEREKEVIQLVVRGLSNKEIAEKMFISANTVMTHRRNIARKTQIHSPAGLTIYAIVNGLINLEDVRL